VCGIFGYILFPFPKGDLIQCFGEDPAALVARIAVGFTALFSFPLMSYNARLALESLSVRIFPSLVSGWPRRLFVIVMLLWCLICYTVAVFWTHIQQVFEFVGAIGGISFALIIPGVILFVTGRRAKSTFRTVLGLSFAIFAVILALASIGVSTWTIIDPVPKANANCTGQLLVLKNGTTSNITDIVSIFELRL
jgi:hypothetical protein